MRGPSPPRLWEYATGVLRLKKFFRSPGDGRPQPHIPARVLYWALLLGHLLRQFSFHSLEALVRSCARRALGLATSFSEDTPAYFTERPDADATRRAAVGVLRRDKRNKAFQESAFIGLALDGTSGGRSSNPHCDWCRPFRNKENQILRYHTPSRESLPENGPRLPGRLKPTSQGLFALVKRACAWKSSETAAGSVGGLMAEGSELYICILSGLPA